MEDSKKSLPKIRILAEWSSESKIVIHFLNFSQFEGMPDGGYMLIGPMDKKTVLPITSETLEAERECNIYRFFSNPMNIIAQIKSFQIMGMSPPYECVFRELRYLDGSKTNLSPIKSSKGVWVAEKYYESCEFEDYCVDAKRLDGSSFVVKKAELQDHEAEKIYEELEGIGKKICTSFKHHNIAKIFVIVTISSSSSQQTSQS